MFHNEALQLLDSIVAAAVEDGPLSSPPSTPAHGDCFIVADAPTGVWAGHAGAIAAFGPAGWRFVAPIEGLQAWVKSTSCWAQYRLGAWALGDIHGSRLLIDGAQVVGSRSAVIADPTGGATVDNQARAAITAVLSAMRHHGLIATE